MPYRDGDRLLVRMISASWHGLARLARAEPRASRGTGSARLTNPRTRTWIPPPGVYYSAPNPPSAIGGATKNRRNSRMTMRRAKISVIGAGNSGGECARSIAMKGLGDVVLLDIPNKDKPELHMPRGKALDLACCGPVEGFDAKLT